MNKLLRYLIAAFFPERCPYCNKTIPAGKPACSDCAALFPDTVRKCYAKGGYPCVAPFSYIDVFSDAVKNFKFHNRTDFAEKLSIQISAAVTEAFGDIQFDCVTCVPMHKNQLKIRGYNQSRILAENVSKLLNIPYDDLLTKHKENEPQHSLKGTEKRDNVKGVYKAANTDKIKGYNILVIDDVITSGHTLGECCKVLKKAGAKKIYCAALCAKIIS